MPRLVHRNPTYRKHRASGQAIVTIGGRDHYLGPFGTKASRDEYDRIIAEWLANGRQVTTPTADLSIAELIVVYWAHVQSYYRKPDGTPSSEQSTIRLALRPLKQLYARTAARDFGPLALKAVRQTMVELGWARTQVNKHIGRLRRMFKWAVENEMIPAAVSHGLQAVAGLRAGRSEAHESAPVLPVPEEHVAAILDYLSPQVRAMVETQLLSGMRPGEVCQMRTCDIDTTGRLWVYKPATHKTQHHGHQRLIYLGPRAQDVLRTWLKPDLTAYLFTPAEAEAWRREKLRAARKTPLALGNSAGTNRQRKPRFQPGARYKVGAYHHAIARGCDAAFPLPEHLARQKVKTGPRRVRWEALAEWRARLGPKLWEEAQAWRTDHRHHPHQYRHNAATRLRKSHGLEAAQCILGHKSLSVTEIYAEKNVAAAQQIMGEVG